MLLARLLFWNWRKCCCQEQQGRGVLFIPDLFFLHSGYQYYTHSLHYVIFTKSVIIYALLWMQDILAWYWEMYIIGCWSVWVKLKLIQHLQPRRERGKKKKTKKKTKKKKKRSENYISPIVFLTLSETLKSCQIWKCYNKLINTFSNLLMTLLEQSVASMFKYETNGVLTMTGLVTILRRVPTLTLRQSSMMLSHLLGVNLGFFVLGENCSGGWFPNYNLREKKNMLVSFVPFSPSSSDPVGWVSPGLSSGLSLVSWSSCWRPQRIPCSAPPALRRPSPQPPPGLQTAPARSEQSLRVEGRRCPACWRFPCWRCRPPPRHHWTGQLRRKHSTVCSVSGCRFV